MGLHQCFCSDGATVPCICRRDKDHAEEFFDQPDEPVEASPVQTQDEERPAEPEGMTTTKSNED